MDSSNGNSSSSNNIMNDFRNIVLHSGESVRFTQIEIDLLEKAHAKAITSSKSTVSWNQVLNYYIDSCKHMKFKCPSSLVYSRTSEQLAAKWKDLRRVKKG